MLSALALGFLGSFHCIGMCGPIVLALPNHYQHKYVKIYSSLLYNMGRVITYGMLGLIFGLLGEGIYLGGMQQAVSIITGAVIIILVLFPYILPAKMKQFSIMKYPLLKNAFSNLFKSESYSAYLLLGLINGLLPCGFVYIALSGALLMGDTLQGSIFMMLFGIGTIPAMFTLSMAGSFVSLSFRNKIKKSIPYLSVIVGLILILRGFNLGIPYVSPMMSHEKQETNVDCCHKPEKGVHVK
jgi:sulfite exporter TauE/SafE